MVVSDVLRTPHLAASKTLLRKTTNHAGVKRGVSVVGGQIRPELSAGQTKAGAGPHTASLDPARPNPSTSPPPSSVYMAPVQLWPGPVTPLLNTAVAVALPLLLAHARAHSL